MKIIITDKKKREYFVSLFQVLKNCSSIINITIGFDEFYIQGMDKSHICLFDVKINKKWFNQFDIKEEIKISFDSNVFHSIISTKNDNQDLIIMMEENANPDIVHIIFSSQEAKKGEFKKTFKMNLIDYDYQEMAIPVVDYDAEFSLSSKQITDMFNQLSNFGNDILIQCSEDDIRLTTNGTNGEMRVDIPIDDLTSYSIVESQVVSLCYSLLYINKMCITNKLSNEIDFSLSNDCPMKINYNLGDDSSLIFFIAPKLND
jgi:proliferating cell nuclear antigen